MTVMKADEAGAAIQGWDLLLQRRDSDRDKGM